MTTKPPAAGDQPTAESLLGDDLEAAILADAPKELEAGIDPNHPVLTVDEQRKALQKAREAVQAERKAQAIADLQNREEDRLRGGVGQMTGDPNRDEIVHVTLNLAEHSDRIALNGRQYFHNGTYQVPRHVADTLRDIQAHGWNQQAEIEGKNLANRTLRPQAPVLSGKGMH